jgi:hypothetical protein
MTAAPIAEAIFALIFMAFPPDHLGTFVRR